MKFLVCFFVIAFSALNAQEGYNFEELREAVARANNTKASLVTGIRVFSAEKEDWVYAKLSREDESIGFLSMMSNNGPSDGILNPNVQITCTGKNCAECDIVDWFPNPMSAKCKCKLGNGGRAKCDMTKTFSSN